MRLKMTTFALLLAAFARPAAAQVNLRVAPYPVPYPFFDNDANKEHTVLSASYVGTTMNIPNAPVLDLNGAVLGVAYRRAVNDQMAWDAQFSIIPEFGRTDFGTKMYSVGVPLSTNFEYQPYKTSNLGVIVFAGPNFGIGSSNYANPTNYGSTVIVPTGEGVNTTGSTTLLYGLQFGAQVGVDAGWAKLAPFLMISPDWGSYTSKYYSGGNLTSRNRSLPATVLTSFGAQIWLNPKFGASLAYQTSPSYTNDGIAYSSFHNLIAGLNFTF